jgi:hypothetical protein
MRLQDDTIAVHLKPLEIALIMAYSKNKSQSLFDLEGEQWNNIFIAMVKALAPEGTKRAQPGDA